MYVIVAWDANGPTDVREVNDLASVTEDLSRRNCAPGDLTIYEVSRKLTAGLVLSDREDMYEAER